ncbi:hypothetical protein [Methanobacterium alcaliphilum]|uniref:hypothetical protein n=1 Tax=Methanobacterium alcaliphilum TaxID=392018 RepID=UPI00200B63FF|nr:hypothetical protein [Methanobacterium alcaliphilum]MCK9151810.1 hypothetical protein [Methanobacterium alcaliphilum]
MAEGLTWTITFQKTMFEDSIGVLGGLERDGSRTTGFINKYFPKGASKSRRLDVMKLLDDLNFVNVIPSRGTNLYKITDIGKNFYFENDLNKKKFIFHANLYQNIFHYSYAFDYILDNDYYEFDKLDFIKTMVISASNDFGTRIHDWKSGENVLNFMECLDILSKENKIYRLNDEYKITFKENELLELVYENFDQNKILFTKSLCEQLLIYSSYFITSRNPPTIEYLYNKLLEINTNKELFKFSPGLPRPPIPTIHTLIELKEESL